MYKKKCFVLSICMINLQETAEIDCLEWFRAARVSVLLKIGLRLLGFRGQDSELNPYWYGGS